MTTKERLHRLVDELSEQEAVDTFEYAASRHANANEVDTEPAQPEQAQPGDIVDEWGNLSAMLDHAAGDLMRRLAEEEAAAGHEPW